MAKKSDLSGNAPEATDTSDDQSNVGNENDANLNPAQPSLAQDTPSQSDSSTDDPTTAPDVGAIPPPEYQSPSVHDLAVQGAEEAFGPDAHNNPGFDNYVKDRESQMRATLEQTQP